jgi:hypothetical protein
MAVTYDTPAQVSATAAAEAGRYARPDGTGSNDMLVGRMPDAVKGAGFIHPGGNQPLDGRKDADEIFERSFNATVALRKATSDGINDTSGVYKSLNPSFVSQFPAFLAQGTPGFGAQGLQQLVGELNQAFSKVDALKNFTLTAPLASGFVPFDLVAPSRLIYPVYTPLRNKLPRVQGQGTSRRVKVMTGISGSQTGNQGVLDISIPELVGGTSITGTWPLNLPGSGAQTAVDLNVPYQFFGLTEALSWLAQFGGQGFEDLSALANLVLLQEFMLAEEYAMIAATPSNLATPGTPTTAARTAGSNETAIGGSPGHYRVIVTAVNYYGETIGSAGSADITSVGTTNVVDVTIAPVAGALQYNLYVATASATPTNAQYFLVAGTTTQASVTSTGSMTAGSVGGLRFTIQGPNGAPTTGANPPLADTGTGKSTRMAGIVPTLDGQATTAGVYPANWQGGYLNQKLGTHLSITAVNNALQGMFDGTGSINPGAFRADPDELIGEGGDIMRMSNDIVQSGQATNFRLMVTQADNADGITTGAAVSEFQNPITRKLIKLLVHPFLTQGTALLMSYALPYTWTNVANVWEMTLVQDYISISWPVIDATFRYSLFMYGALVANAPYYCARLGGIQVSDTTPYA